MGKKQEEEKLNRPPIKLETEDDWVRVYKKGESALPSEDRTGTAVSTFSLSLRNRRAARVPRGERPIKATVRIIAKYFWKNRIELSLRTFECLADETDDTDRRNFNDHRIKIFYSRNRPSPPLQFTGVDSHKRVIKAQRVDNPNKKLEIGFDTIERYLRDIKKELPSPPSK